ncbi:NDR1/HIN1-like protein 2 [Phalaenopsis equestris]|uniref:NDR1/HIN1-like protein 2 n=1 Tax=Phalaenopsis equestris TaxID=78828 RepID=UPI0009E560A6|nr:NDR1/HIN1-like protein 2 [Phalaenopsis equestris]
MAESKEFQLNEPYYGPPIPPSQPPPRNSPTPLKFNFDVYSLLCTITKVTTVFLIIIGVIVLALWLIYQPQSIKVYAESASLSTFNLSVVDNNTLLAYDLAVNFTFRNPNRKYSIYYERVDVQALYGGYQIESMRLSPLRQQRKSSMPVGVRFEGRRETAAGDNYGREKGEGFFRIRVKMYVTVRLKMIVVESVKFKPDVDCDLRVPAPGNSTSLAAGFVGTDCDVSNFS